MKGRIEKTAEAMLEEARLVILDYPDNHKILDPLDGKKLLTKKELLKKFDGDNDFAAVFASKVVFGLKLDQFMRKGKK